MLTAVLSDEEIDAICDGLKQNAAKVRYLRDTLTLPVHRIKPALTLLTAYFAGTIAAQ